MSFWYCPVLTIPYADTLMAAGDIRRKCFVSYHHADLPAVNRFTKRFGPRNFIKRGIILPEDAIESRSADYVMRRVRELHIRDSTATIVLVGPCTWPRRVIDWEIQASLRPAGGYPNGLVGIGLTPGKRPPLPSRFELIRASGCARCHDYPPGIATLGAWIEDAFQARLQRSWLRRSTTGRFLRNPPCR